MHDNRFHRYRLSARGIVLGIPDHAVNVALYLLPEIFGTSKLYLRCRGGYDDDRGKSYYKRADKVVYSSPTHRLSIGSSTGELKTWLSIPP